MTFDDPYYHLHDEDYAAPFAKVRAVHADMIAMGGRKRIPLSGTWRFTTDLFDEGLRQKWYRDPPDTPADWRIPRDYEDAAADLVPVPSCWTVQKPEWRYFEGSGWYVRHFSFPPAHHGERVFLRVGAANYQAIVFLNGIFLASHRGGSTPFFIDVTAHLQPGDNRLMIAVDNRRRPERVPMHHCDWFNHGGLYREVDLVVVPAVFIKDIVVTLVPDGSFGTIAAHVEISEALDSAVDLAIPELGIAARIPVTAGRGTLRLAARPELWSPATPRLYEVEARLGGDVVRERIGFREIKVRGHEILLNGQPLYLRGICVHEDDAELGKATTEADLRRRFTHVRELGANFVRLAHYPHHERAAELADELGILLWEEIPVYWAIDFANPGTYADAENQLLEMIRRDRNRASVIIWGVGNENADTDARYAFMSRLAHAARGADPTRLISAACLINRQTFCIEDRLAADLDVIGLNEYFGWYEPDMTGLERLIENSRPGKPVVISECGADAEAGHIGAPGALFSEEHQVDVFRRQLQILARADYVQGFCPWIMYDFQTERRHTRHQRGWNRKGLIAGDKATKKRAFHFLAEHYRSLNR